MLMIHDLQKQVACPNGEQLTIVRVPYLQVARGEQLAIIGASGSGKTSLLHLISGLLKATQGQIVFEGVHVEQMQEQERDRWRAENIGYIFQRFNLLDSLTVEENILAANFFARHTVTAEAKIRTKRLLKLVGLESKMAFMPSRLSMGEQQRVAIVRAIINQPKLILADEPTASLDSENRQIVLQLLKTVCQKQNSSLLLSTHDQAVIKEFSAQYHMLEGRLTS